MDLIIIRHARPVRDERGEGEGTADPELAPIGHQQAQAVADFLQHEGIDHVAASPMKRAHQTAMPLASLLGLEIELLEQLKEVDHTSSTYIPGDEITPDDEVYKTFTVNPMAIFDGVGGYEVFRDTVVTGFDHLISTNRGKTVAAFCHGMVTSVYLGTLLGMKDPYQLSPDYTGITRVRASSNGIRTVRSANEHAHVRNLLT